LSWKRSTGGGRISGEGTRFGEFGGAGELVDSAVQAVAHEWTQRGPKTLLTRLFIDLAGAKDLLDLIEGIDLGRYYPDAAWAPAVFQAAYSGDPAAKEVIERSGRELGDRHAYHPALNIQELEFMW
jgi:N-acetylglucosamine kinase-like BadF-type ATPase